MGTRFMATKEAPRSSWAGGLVALVGHRKRGKWNLMVPILFRMGFMNIYLAYFIILPNGCPVW